jgi:hypothetical protein
MEPFTASDIGILIVSFYIVTVHGVIASLCSQGIVAWISKAIVLGFEVLAK